MALSFELYDYQFNSNVLDLKIRHYLCAKNKLDHLLSFQNYKIHYYEEISVYLQQTALCMKKSRKQRNQVKSTLMGSYSKIKQLEKEAICWKAGNRSVKKGQEGSKNSNGSSTGKCINSEHIKYILESRQREKQAGQIEKLRLQKQQIVNRISQKLQQDEPYVHETVLRKILRETKRAGKLQLIRDLEAAIIDKRKWLPCKKQQIDQQCTETCIEDSIKANLQKMKEIASQKIEIDDYVRDVCLKNEGHADSKQSVRTSQRVKNAFAALKEKVISDEKQMEECELEYKLQQQQQQKSMNASNILNKQQIESLNEIIGKGIEMIRKPLGNQEKNEEEENLNERINALNSIFLQNRKKRL